MVAFQLAMVMLDKLLKSKCHIIPTILLDVNSQQVCPYQEPIETLGLMTNLNSVASKAVSQ